MAVAFRAANTPIVGVGTSPTASEPAGTVQGDLLIAQFVVDWPGGTPGIPSGWTSIWSGTSASTHFRYNIAYIVRGASAPDLTFTHTGSEYRELSLLAFSGADTSTPIDSQSSVTSVSGTLTHPDPPATTAVNAATIAVVFQVFWTGAPVTGWTPPAGYTIRGTTSSAAYGSATKQLSSAGSEDPGSFGGTPVSGADDGVAMVLTIAPVLVDNTTKGVLPQSLDWWDEDLLDFPAPGVTSPAVDGIGDVVDPSITAGAVVTSTPAVGAGDVPAPGVSADFTATSPAATGVGDVPSPTVSGEVVVISPAASGVGDVPTPGVSADAVVVSPVADGTGDVPSPVVSAGASVTAPAVDGVGDIPTPTISPSGIPPFIGPGVPTVIGTTDSEGTSTDYAIGRPFKRSSFTALGMSWVFWGTSSGANYSTTTDDSNSWTTAYTAPMGGNALAWDLHFDGTYVHVVVGGGSGGSGTEYYRGTPDSSGFITWDSVQSVPLSSGFGDHTWEVSINTDSDGYPWIAFEEWPSSGNARVTVTTSTTKNGTWTTRSGYPLVLSSASVAPYVELNWTHIARLNDAGKMICFFWYEGNIYAKVYSGSSWGSHEGPLDVGHLHDTQSDDIAFATDSVRGTACIAWCDGSNVYSAHRTSAGSWTQTLVDPQSVRSLAMSVDGDGDFHLWMVPDNNTGSVIHWYRQRTSSTWFDGSAPFDLSGTFEEIPGPAIQTSEMASGARIIVSFQTLDQTNTAAPDTVYGYIVSAPAAVGGTGGTPSGDATVTSPAIDGVGDVVTPGVAAGSTAIAPPVDGTGDVPDPSVSAGAGVTAPPVDGVGDVPDPTVAAGVVVTPPAGAGTGDVPAPAVAADASVTAPPVDGTGTVPPVSQIVSMLIDLTGVYGFGAGSLPAPTVSGSAAGTVVSPALDGVGSVPTPGVSAGASTTEPPVDGTGDVPDPGVSGGVNEVAPVVDGTGDVSTPSVSADVVLTPPPADGTGDVPTSSTTAGGVVQTPAAAGVGDVPVPGVSGGVAVYPDLVQPTGALVTARVTYAIAGRTTMALVTTRTTKMDIDNSRTTSLEVQPRATGARVEARATTHAEVGRVTHAIIESRSTSTDVQQKTTTMAILP